MFFSAQEYLPKGLLGLVCALTAQKKSAQTEQPSGWGLGYLSRNLHLSRNLRRGNFEADATLHARKLYRQG
jgi:hypothetical protein